MKKMKKTLAILLALVMVFALVACGGGTEEAAPPDEGAAPASEPVTIKMQGAFAEGGTDYYYFEQFCADVYERSGGTLTVEWGAGPEAIPTDQLADAMMNGVVELVYSPITYLVTADPALNGVKLMDPIKTRQEGGTELIEELVQGAVNSHFLARVCVNSPYYFMSNKPIKTLADWKGMIVRGTPAYKPFLAAVGAEMVTMGFGDVYQAAEKNVINGCGATLKNFVDIDLGAAMDYLIDPGVYCSDSSLLITNVAWDKLDDVQRQALLDSAIDWENDSATHYAAENVKFIEEIVADGATVNSIEGADREEFLKVAYDSAWKVVEDANADIAAQMREFSGN